MGLIIRVLVKDLETTNKGNISLGRVAHKFDTGKQSYRAKLSRRIIKNVGTQNQIFLVSHILFICWSIIKYALLEIW